jgi:signal transduction histidine kinase
MARYFFNKAISHHHRLDMKYEEAKSLRDFGLFYEECHQPGLARDCFNQAYALFGACGALLETNRLEDRVDPALLRPRPRQAEERDTSTGSFEAADQIRVDTLYNASLSLSRAGAIDELLRQVVLSLIKATGAQYGMLHLDGDEFHEPRELVLNFENKALERGAVQFSTRIMDMARRERTVIVSRDAAGSQVYESAAGKTGSALCVPLGRGDKYFGCVYLTNTLVSGLFSEGAVKAAQIIAAQAGFFIENAWLMEEYKRLNERLEQKVKDQTHDIRDKNEQLQNANLKLIESERMKDLLSGSIVHDIKNHVFSIAADLRALDRFRIENKEAKEVIAHSSAICASASNLAANILDIGKMEEGRLTIRPVETNGDAIAAIADRYAKNVVFQEKNISVEIASPPAGFSISADLYLLDRVMQNLFSNAAKYTIEGGRVELSFETSETENIVGIFSSGPPIPDEFKPLLFEKYGRVDGKSSQYSKGLGLFFCRMVMTAHQGRIWLETDGQGNHFKMGFRKI